MLCCLTDRFGFERQRSVRAGRLSRFPAPPRHDRQRRLPWNALQPPWRFELRYQALENPLAVTPLRQATGHPIHDYVTLGHAAPGKGLDEYTVGFYAGPGRLDPWIPRTYFHARYGYSFVEKVAGDLA